MLLTQLRPTPTTRQIIMPEGPENFAFATRIEKSIQDFEKKYKKPLHGKLVLFPSNWALGTKERKWTTFSADCSGYSGAQEPEDPSYKLDPFDEQKLNARGSCGRGRKSQYQDARYLMKGLKEGPLLVAIRGKLMALGAGYHCMVIHWGLEAHPIEVKRQLFDELTAVSLPGPNKQKSKAEMLRQFRIPERLIAVGSSASQRGRFVRCMAAIVCDDRTFMICDFARLVRIHIISKDNMWSKEDLQPGSKEWGRLWNVTAGFSSGPDWRVERQLAESNLRNQLRTLVLDNPSMRHVSLIDLLTSNKFSAPFFSPFGRHLANDFLHVLGLFPTMPAFELFQYPVQEDDHDAFITFVDAALKYVDKFFTDSFKHDCATRNSNDNPFSFQFWAAKKYDSSYMRVFRKAVVQTPRDLYEAIVRKGLMDPDHIIGGLYVANKQAFKPLQENTKSIRLPVYFRGKPADNYTVIRARVPERWKDGDERNARDHLLEGFKTTVGPGDFIENKLNMPDPQNIDDFKRKAGRPKKAITKTPRAMTFPRHSGVHWTT
ncbi:hypothetical protein WG66_013420 [Moniliophthora roreri]|nr:hypothetical protein WG66_013420 [Moniliophthora roreri]